LKLNQIYNEDCYQVIKRIPDESIDLILTDPPYLIGNLDRKGAGFLANKSYLKGIQNAGIQEGFDLSLLKEFQRVLKRMNLIVFCNKKQIYDYLTFAENNKYIWDIIVWVKENPVPMTNNVYLPDTEYIFHIREQSLGLNGTFDTKKKFYLTKINHDALDTFDHPTVKPLLIVRNLMTNASNEGFIVLDPFVGSGTTAVAAKQLKRKYIGVEINEKFYNIAVKRLAQDSLSSFSAFEQKTNEEDAGELPDRVETKEQEICSVKETPVVGYPLSTVETIQNKPDFPVTPNFFIDLSMVKEEVKKPLDDFKNIFTGTYTQHQKALYEKAKEELKDEIIIDEYFCKDCFTATFVYKNNVIKEYHIEQVLQPFANKCHVCSGRNYKVREVMESTWKNNN
jgi:DNA modification methylase